MWHSDACAQINEWSQKENGLYLAVSLRVQAQGLLGNLPLQLRQYYKELAKSLEERISPPQMKFEKQCLMNNLLTLLLM
jgi:hypothetical protein